MTGFNSPAQFVSPEGGVLLVDKPLDWTSFDVIRKLRGMLRVRKMGHAGTLDPLATGLLILCSGPLTRRIDSFQALDKTYTGDLALGAVTASFDAATPPEPGGPWEHLTREDLQNAADGFTGVVSQLPPMFSAVKKEGQRLYSLARKGITVERAPRSVAVHRFSVEDFDPPRVGFRVDCGKGTYVRALVHDLGQALGCGAYLRSLRRTAIGEYRVEDAWTLEALAADAAERARSREGGADADRA